MMNVVEVSMICDTCGVQTELLRRDVLDKSYNALDKIPLWNCEKCYIEKRERREQSI